MHQPVIQERQWQPLGVRLQPQREFLYADNNIFLNMGCNTLIRLGVVEASGIKSFSTFNFRLAEPLPAADNKVCLAEVRASKAARKRQLIAL